jgi:outer membrane receptor protein involved in Fe transport
MATTRSTLGLTLVLVSPIAMGGIARAQQEPAPAEAAEKPAEGGGAEQRQAGEEKPQVVEDILVTGSRIRRKDLNTPAPVTVLNREQLEQSGKASIGEFLQSLPEQGNAPNYQFNNGGSTYSDDGATRVNLRSLGVTRTLVLINGRRVVTSGVGASSAVDLNTIPAEAVERIEVLKDGASAIYGSDAIAGVVNIVTRKGFDGTEATAQYGVSSRGDARTFDAHVITGRSGEAGNFLFSVGYLNQGSSWLRDRSWSSRALTWDYNTGTAIPGGSFRTPQGTIALPKDPNDNPLPACLANPVCSAIVNSDPNWRTDAFIRDPGVPSGWRIMTDADTYNFAAENYLTIPSSRARVYSSGDTKLGAARGFYEMSYVQHTSQQNAAPMPLNPGDYTLPGSNTPISVSPDSLYNPFGVSPDFAGRRLVEFGHRTYTQELGTFRVVTGLDGTLPEGLGPLRGWYWDAALNYGRTSGTFTTGGAIRNSKIADAVGPSMLVNGVPTCVKTAGDPTTAIPGCVPLNLFGGPNNGTIDPSQIDSLGFEGTSRAFDSLLGVSVNTVGEIFSLGSDRAVSLALGYEFRRHAGAQVADPIAASGDSADFNFKSTQGHFTVNEAYAELSLPLLANVPGATNLDASLAGRYVDYSTFGSNFSYKIGARWVPIPDVALRGTFSTAFRAPSISELYLGQAETAPTVSDPCANLSGAPPALVTQCQATGVPASGSGDAGNQELTHVGGNSALKAETAKIFTAGVVLQPSYVPNLSVTVDYYRTAVDNVVGTLGTPTILQACYPAGFNSNAPPAYCNLITRAPTSGRILFVTDVNQNVGELRTAGVDLAARYALPTAVGRFGFTFDATWLAFFDRTQKVGTTTQTVHGRGNYDLGALPIFKANVGASWARAGWGAGATARYVGSFKECGAFSADSGTYQSTGGLCNSTDPQTPSRQVGSNAVVDLRGSYALTTSAGKTTVAAGVNNVFDKAPQYVYSAALANSDPSIYDYVGRFVYLRLQHAF